MTEARISVPDAFVEETATSTRVERQDAPSARFSLLGSMYVERGDKSDWDKLHELHYKAEALPMGPRFYRLVCEGQTVGCVVTGTPKGLLKERHIAFPHIKPDGKDTKLTNTYRYKWINQNMRVASRIVLDTMYRGCGAGARMVNLVGRLEGAPIMEIQSSMSKFNLFAQKAGYRFVRPMNSLKYEQGLKFFRSHFESHPSDGEAIIAEIEAMGETLREQTLQAVRDFYYRHSALEKTGNNRDNGQKRVDAMDARTLVRSLQQLTLASPMYGVWKNPDAGRQLPSRLYLAQFDTQKPTEPLVLPSDQAGA